MAKLPNILLVTTDQQRTDTLGCYGAGYVRTPNLDGLARDGMRFERAYTVNPVCTPTRVSMFTGVMPSRHGAWNVGVGFQGGRMTLPEQLKMVGYRTRYVGKMHFEPWSCAGDVSVESIRDWPKRFPEFDGPYYGFEKVEMSMGHATYGISGHYGAWVRSQVSAEAFESFRQAQARSVTFGGEALDWDLPTRLHSSVWTADRTCAFLEKETGDGKPFFLAVGFEDPHHPHALPTDFADRVDPAAVALPEYAEGELADKPEHFLENHEGRIDRSWARGDYPVAGPHAGINFSDVPEQAVRLGRAYYYSLCNLIDAQMGRILEVLQRRGLAENTSVIFTSDHGEMLGDHGMWCKGPFSYEQLLRIPLIIRWPGVTRPGSAGVTEARYSHVDLARTLMEMAGCLPETPLDGVDLRPVLSGEKTSVREHCFVECVDDPRKLRTKCVITRDRKLVWYSGQELGELYDLEKDPGEKVNRWSDAAYAAEKSRLLGAILGSLEPLDKRLPRICYA